MNHDLVRIVALVIVLVTFVLYIRTVSKRRKADHEEDCQDEGTCNGPVIPLPECAPCAFEAVEVFPQSNYTDSVEGANDPAHDAVLTRSQIVFGMLVGSVADGGILASYYLPFHDGGVNFVDGLALEDNVNPMEIYCPYHLSVGSVPTCDFGPDDDGSIMSFNPVSYWRSPDAVSAVNTITTPTGTDTLSVNWTPIDGMDEYAVEFRVFGTLNTADDITPIPTPLNLRYGGRTTSTSISVAVPALDFWGGSIDDIEVRVRGYRYCDLGDTVELCVGGFVD